VGQAGDNPQEAEMIHVYGEGRPGDLTSRILRDAQGASVPAFAIAAGLWAHRVHRDERRHHRMHVGAKAWTLHLDNGRSFAFRGKSRRGICDRIDVDADAARPLGPITLTIESPKDTEALWGLLDTALDSG
jgi:hypothetical protein